jgi:hypothetical protein
MPDPQTRTSTQTGRMQHQSGSLQTAVAETCLLCGHEAEEAVSKEEGSYCKKSIPEISNILDK